jgi:phosphonoacetaldehyde hydrolase
MGNSIEGVIFDWAGTTVDFGCMAPIQGFLKAFEAHGIEVTLEQARKPMGQSKRAHIKTMLEMPEVKNQWLEIKEKKYTTDDVDSIYHIFKKELMSNLVDFTDPIDEVVEVVKALSNDGLKIGSTTGYTDEMMSIVSKGSKEKGYLPDAIVTSDATNKIGRPYPYMIFENMKRLKIKSPLNVIKIGDTKMDILEGLNAGVWTVGVAIGSSQMGLSLDEFNSLTKADKAETIESTKAQLKAYGAHFIIESMNELPDLLEKINMYLSKGKTPYEF